MYSLSELLPLIQAAVLAAALFFLLLGILFKEKVMLKIMLVNFGLFTLIGMISNREAFLTGILLVLVGILVHNSQNDKNLVE